MPSSDSDSEPENTKYNTKTQIKLTVQTMAESSSAEHIAIENRKFMPKLPSSQGVKAVRNIVENWLKENHSLWLLIVNCFS